MKTAKPAAASIRPDSSTHAATRRSRVYLAMLLVFAAGLATVVGALFMQWRVTAQADSARAEGLAAAVDLTPKLLSYDYRKSAAQLPEAQKNTTGDFRTEYENLIKQHVSKRAAAQQFVTKVRVQDRSIVTAEPERLVTMLFLSQVTTSTELNGRRLDNSSVRVAMMKIDGRWLVAGLERV